MKASAGFNRQMIMGEKVSSNGMKIVEIRKLSTDDLAIKSTKLREEIADLRRSLYSGETQNVRIIRHKRKDLARMLTVLGEQLAKEAR